MAEKNVIPRHKNVKDETGKTYGKLTVIRQARSVRVSCGTFAMWECRCTCGALVVVRGNALRTGKIKSCSRECGKTQHGHATDKPTPEYRAWVGMRGRCTNAKCRFYHNYGGRGVTVCERWQSFAAFLDDVGKRPSSKHSLDRINNNGNYEPGNVRWATKEVQDNNRRTCRFITFNGVTQTITQWARVLGVHPVTLHLRLKSGWSLEKTLTTVKNIARP